MKGSLIWKEYGKSVGFVSDKDGKFDFKPHTTLAQKALVFGILFFIILILITIVLVVLYLNGKV